MMRPFPHATAALAAACLGSLLCGCRGDLYETVPVTGTVMCNGKPALGGYVIFQPVDAPDQTGRPKGEPGRLSRGLVKEDGSFSLVMDPRGADVGRTGALVGPHKILFVPPITKPIPWDPSDNWLPKEDQDKLKAELLAIQIYEPLECGPQGIAPAEVEVTDGENSFEFTLKPGTGRPAPRGDEPIGSSGAS